MSRPVIALGAAILLVTSLAAAAQPPAFRTVVFAGQPAPGGGTFEHFTIESQPVVAPPNARGEVAFFATLLRGAGTEGLFLATARGIGKVAVEGDRAPGGGTLSGLGRHPIPSIEGRGVPGGVFTATGDRPRMLVGAGEECTLGGIFEKFSERVAVNDASTVAFTAILKGAPARSATFVVEGDRVRKVVALGDAAPAGGAFSNFGFWPVLSASGTVAFTASVDPGPPPIGVFVAGSAGTRKVAAVGDSLPGGATLRSFGLYPTVTMGASGAVTFATAPTATGEGGEGIYIADTARLP
jgi:hypothetical protein